MNRYRQALFLVVLAPLGVAAWFLLAASTPRTSPKPLPAAIPAPATPAPPPAASGDEDLVASWAQRARQVSARG